MRGEAPERHVERYFGGPTDSETMARNLRPKVCRHTLCVDGAPIEPTPLLLLLFAPGQVQVRVQFARLRSRHTILGEPG